MRVKKAVIPAAGFGTRMLPATKAVPKEMLALVDKPVIQYVVEELAASGIEEILIITGRGKGVMEDHFDYAPELEEKFVQNGDGKTLGMLRGVADMANIYWTRQKAAKGLGHAVACAKSFTADEPFLVVLPDDLVVNEGYPCSKQMIDTFESAKKSVVGVQRVDRKDISKYGCAGVRELSERCYEVTGLVEKPKIEEALSDLAVMGRYVFTQEIYEAIAKTKPGHGGEIQLTDAMKLLMENKKLLAFEFEGRRFDTGSKLGYMTANVEMALKHPEIAQSFQDYLKERVKTL